MSDAIPRIVISVGEPAGVGPDLVLHCANLDWPAELVVVADRELLEQRARQIGTAITCTPYYSGKTPKPHKAGELPVIHIPLATPALAGELDKRNSTYVLAALNQAAELCIAGEAQALVTGPIQKSVINEAGIPFSGHTEFLAALTETPQVVMLLASNTLRVALATTHIPLSQVPSAITEPLLLDVLTLLHTDLIQRFGIPDPHIAVLGLNPHAGEGGHLGTEEITIIEPVIKQLQARNMRLTGPLPADTAFNLPQASDVDAYLAMYHDQGLPVLKYSGFGAAVNITLGLPITRVSVDHGTALKLAGTGKADPSSLKMAITSAIDLAKGP